MGFLAPCLWWFWTPTIPCSQRPISASKLFPHEEQFNFLPLLLLPIWGPPSHNTQNGTRPPSPPSSLQRKEQSPVQLISAVMGICKVSLRAIIFLYFLICRQHSLALTLKRPPYICITGHFIFICQTFVSCSIIAMMLMTFLFSATEAAVI